MGNHINALSYLKGFILIAPPKGSCNYDICNTTHSVDSFALTFLGLTIVVYFHNVDSHTILDLSGWKLVTSLYSLLIFVTFLCVCNFYLRLIDWDKYFFFTDGGSTTAINYDLKKGFMCTGIGVSANNVFLALFLSPSNYTQQSLESHQIHVGHLRWFPRIPLCIPTAQNLSVLSANSRAHA